MIIAFPTRQRGKNEYYHWQIWQAAAAANGWEFVGAEGIEGADVVVLWGLPPPNVATLEACRKVGKPVLVLDYPYWNRPGPGRDGAAAWKVSLNGLHPTPYLMNESHDSARFRASGGPAILPWRKDGIYVLLAGMGPKAEETYGYKRGQWDEEAAQILHRHTSLPVVYRAKPKVNRTLSVPGAIIERPDRPIGESFAQAVAVVTHHGNAAVEALAAGVPVFVKDGVAALMGRTELSRIMDPLYPDNRGEFFCNLAHWQWTGDEIRAGLPVHSLMRRGLL